MSASLCFNDITLTLVTHQNSLWIRAVELARALGYNREDKVAQIYKRNAEEFTQDMTQIIECAVEPQFEGQGNLSVGRARIFSLRGCHLIAMFARTPVAKQFRRWVLDVLDKLAEEERAKLAGNVKPKRTRKALGSGMPALPPTRPQRGDFSPAQEQELKNIDARIRAANAFCWNEYKEISSALLSFAAVNIGSIAVASLADAIYAVVEMSLRCKYITPDHPTEPTSMLRYFRKSLG